MVKNRKLKIVFAGTPEFSVPFLDALRREEHIAAVITRPDRPAGRKRKPAPPPVKIYAVEKQLNLLQPENINATGTVNELKRIGPELIVVVSYGGFLKKPVLKLPPLGCLNIHPSLLPKYRGPCPVERALMNGDSVTGASSIRMDEGMDSGPVISREEVGIDANDNRETLSKKLAEAGVNVLRNSLQQLKTGTAIFRPQEGEPVYAPFISKEETEIDWTKSAFEIHNLIRALQPSPGARTTAPGTGERIIIRESALPEEKASGGMTGEIAEVSDSGAVVCCGTGSIIIKAVQPEGGKRQDMADFLRGRNLEKLG